MRVTGSGGTMTPGYLAVSCPCTQSKSRKRRVTENWPNLYCGSDVLVVTWFGLGLRLGLGLGLGLG